MQKTHLSIQSSIGLSPEAFERGILNGTVVGHIGFEQSIWMIADALGWVIDDIIQIREPIISSVRRETPFVVVEPGQVAGCRHSATAYRQGHAAITMIHPQEVSPHLEGVETCDSLEIKGSPDMHIECRPEIPGGQATEALAVNMIPHVLQADAGLYAMADLPVPAAMLGNAGFSRFNRSVRKENGVLT